MLSFVAGFSALWLQSLGAGVPGERSRLVGPKASGVSEVTRLVTTRNGAPRNRGVEILSVAAL